MKKRTVLFVDDDKNMLRALERTLADEPYESIFADNTDDAFEALETTDVQAVVSDLHMPDMSGLAFLNVVKNRHPRVIRLIFSGDTGADSILDAINNGEVFRYIPKPCNNKELKAIIRQAIDYYLLFSERSMLLSYIEKLVDNHPDKINLKLIKTLISDANKHLYEWCEDCQAGSLDSDDVLNEVVID